jgi:hypothetical protein
MNGVRHYSFLCFVQLSPCRKMFQTIDVAFNEDLDLRRRKWREAGEGCTVRSFITCSLHQMLLGRSKQGGCDWQDM